MFSRLLSALRDALEDLRHRRLGRQAESELAAAPPPCVIGATGGSGTRVITMLLQELGIWIGANLNPANDSEDVARFLRRWIPHWHDWQEDGAPAERLERMQREFRTTMARHREGIADPRAAWSIKNPRTIYILPFLERALPGFRFVHLVRDGRDMAFSSNQSQLDDHGLQYLGAAARGDRALASIRLWSLVNLAAADYGEREMAGRYLRLRFEDFCSDPTATTRTLYDFLGLDGDASITGRVVKAPSSLGRWRDRDAALIARLEDAAGEALRRFGYEPGC
ncbi:MAG: sulfotransferase [Planctomycetes bacterium]|nr:sulfotransferase [Planctomycetota bacterium]